MSKLVTISGVEVRLKSSGALPRLYRRIIGGDIFEDVTALEQAAKKNAVTGDMINTLENIAFVMAKHADETITDNIEEWLEQFGMFGVIQALPEILALWTSEISTRSESKKKNEG